MKRALSLVFALTLCLTLAVPARAYDMGCAGEHNIFICCGGNYSAAIDANGGLWTWGFNSRGQLGDGTERNRGTPKKILDSVIAVSCGGEFMAAIKTDGSLWMWGSNGVGQLGDGTFENRSIPIKVMDNVASVSCGEYHTAAIKTDGSLWAWGDNEFGELGSGTIEYSFIPVKVMDNVASVSCGEYHTAAIKTDGSLWMWGENSFYQLGDGTEENRNTPVKVLDSVAAVSCGLYHTAALKTDGGLWAWGANCYGELGTSSKESCKTPTKIMNNVAAISCGTSHTAAIKTDGTLLMWGWNMLGQVGDGTKEDRSTPAKVMDNVAAVSCGGDHTAAIKADGSLWMWGINYENSLLGYEGGNSDPDSVPIQTLPRQLTALSLLQASAKPGKSGFFDVPDSAYYADAVLWAVTQGVTNGTSSTTFSPDNTCTTAQILTFLHRAKGSPAPTRDNPYSDVKSGDYFYDAALWARENGLTGDGSFNGGTPCTRAAVVTYLWKLAGKPSVGSADFSDVPTSADYAQAVAWAVAQGITNGTGETTFSPDATCTRGQIVTFLYRAYAN